MATTSNANRYAAVVVGAGPAGIVVVGELLEQKRLPILWVDPQFEVGRMGTKYRQVPSNTRVKVLLETANATSINRNIIKKMQENAPNPITVLEEMDQIKGCDLTYAVDMLEMFQKEFTAIRNVEKAYGTVDSASYSSDSKWSVKLSTDEQRSITSDMLVLCTGSHPRTVTSSLPLPSTPIHDIDLDTALTPKLFSATLPSTPSTIAVLGTSHSAILILMNIARIRESTGKPIQVKWFTRHPLRYAEFMDGWTLRDNTGLKGLAADFARENLEDDKLPQHASWLTKVPLPADAAGENAVYERELKDCTHLTQAVGYVPNKIPELFVNGGEVQPVFDNVTSGFVTKDDGKAIPSLYGAGIAFPELVTDPLGNKEMNVGIWKFVKFVKRVSPDWQ